MATGSLTSRSAIAPGSKAAGFPVLVDMPEATSQVGKIGSPIFINASGNAQVIAHNGTQLYGFLAKDAQNGATDGAKTSKVYKIGPTERFEGMLSVASWDQTLVGSKVGLASATSLWYLNTHTSLSASAQAVILGVNSNWTQGDTNPTVIFSIVNAYVQGEV